MSKVYWIDRGWQPVHLGFCPSKKAWDTVMKEFNIIDPPEFPTSSGFTQFLCNEITGDALVLVSLNNDDKQPLLNIIGLIAHEAVHVFDFICEHINEDEPSKEFKAYSIQMITMELLEAWRKSRKKGNIFS